MALSEKRADAALDRTKKQIALVPKSGALQYLLGHVHQARREPKLAEAAYLKALEMDPGLVGVYVDLGSLYAASGKDDQALAKLEEALRANARDRSGATTAGRIYTVQ